MVINSLMEEPTESEELEMTNKLMMKFIEFLVSGDLDYSVVSWDSGEGRNITLTSIDDELNKDYNISFGFRNNGYVDIEVEKIEKKIEEKE